MTPSDLKKIESETIKDFKIRICSNKDVYGLTWEEIKDLINKQTGDTYGESVYRKWWTAFSEGLEIGKSQNILDEEVLNEYELKKIEAETAVKKVQSVKIEYNKMLRENSRFDLKWDMVKESIEKLPAPDFQSDNFYPVQNDKVGIQDDSVSSIQYSFLFIRKWLLIHQPKVTTLKNSRALQDSYLYNFKKYLKHDSAIHYP